MMRLFLALIVSLGIGFFCACTPVKLPVHNKYQLSKYSAKRFGKAPEKRSVMVAMPQAAAGYETERMLYMNVPYRLSAFIHNAWTSPPANMLYALVLKSLQCSDYFYAVVSSPYAEQVDYRLNIQLLTLHQDFLKRPSFIELAVKVVLTHVNDSEVIASKIISQRVCAPMESPYGGVLAANIAAEKLTAAITQFVIQHSR